MADHNVNALKITQGFQILLKALAPFVTQNIKDACGPEWWEEGVLGRLYEEQKKHLPLTGDFETLTASLDISLSLLLLDLYWKDVFRQKLSRDNRTWVKELQSLRNKQAHPGSADFKDEDTWRALDTMSRLCDSLDAEKAEDIRSLLREVRYGSAQGSTALLTNQEVPNAASSSILPNHTGLPAWRDVIEPHPDVAQGRYVNAEFAADLAQVARGEGAMEYLDPVEFFARTYITEGMRGLLTMALKRTLNRGGEPVLQLKTAFGGGKTHSMLALYHLMRGRAPLEKIPSLKPLLNECEVESIPKVHVAVLVGTALNPSVARNPANLPGVKVNTLWGELAYQLAISTGKPKLYDIVKEADKKGTSPGSVALRKLFDNAGSCVILIDELVAYAKKLYGIKGLPAGSFDNFISFIQELGEAAKASKSSMVIASIPESDIEIGGESGKEALKAIEHTFGRMETIWKPVSAAEGFEIVRRRLFLDCKDPEARDRVCDSYSEMYNENPQDFPVETREVEYRKRLAACYPIHPEVFDRLYEDWATLERFQRTRGVLRLMAAVIHELWMKNDQSPFIQPGTLSLDAPAVRDELLRYLESDNWNAILDKEVDGSASEPFFLDRSNPRYGKTGICRRIARTIMLGSAPTVKEQKVRGVEAIRLKLGIARPGEGLSLLSEAMRALQNKLAYLYSNYVSDPEEPRLPKSERYWYDTRPTLRKTVEDRALNVDPSDVEWEIENRLREVYKKVPLPLQGIHVCPVHTQDVPDDQTARLVVFGPQFPYVHGEEDNKAVRMAAEILAERGTSPRLYKNMLLFLAPAARELKAVEGEVRRYLAWKSIQKDVQNLNLDFAQQIETENSLRRSDETVGLLMKEAWLWFLMPCADKDDRNRLVWQRTRLSVLKDEQIMDKILKKINNEELIVTKWSPAMLLMELNEILWKQKAYLEIKVLWDYLCQYLYLPRLANFDVLADAVAAGVQNSGEYFAWAEGIADDRFIDLKYNTVIKPEKSGFLVKKEAAQIQIEAEEAKKQKQKPAQSANESYSAESASSESDGSGVREIPAFVKPRHFYLKAKVDATRVNRDVSKIVEEVLSHLVNEGSMEIYLDVEARARDGFEQQTVRTVTENGKTLKLDNFGFVRE